MDNDAFDDSWIEAKAAPRVRAKEEEERCAAQRRVCQQLLERWVPLAVAESLAIQREVRGKEVIEEEAIESGLKAGAFVLKVLERMARLDGLDAAEKRELSVTERADPLDLARRVEVVSPLLSAKLHEAFSKERVGLPKSEERRPPRKRKAS